MCLAVPLELKEINGNEALAERDGIGRTIRIDFIKDAKPGDCVLVHAGFAIERISKKQAEETAAAVRELEEAIAGLSLPENLGKQRL